MSDVLRCFQALVFATAVFAISNSMSAQELERGVSFELAQHRAATISNVEYDLKFKLSKS